MKPKRYQVRRLDWPHSDDIVWGVIDTRRGDLVCASSTDREFMQRVADGRNEAERYA